MNCDEGARFEIVAMEADAEQARAEIERLRFPWRNVDALDWAHMDRFLPMSGHGQFWRSVLAEMRAALVHEP